MDHCMPNQSTYHIYRLADPNDVPNYLKEAKKPGLNDEPFRMWLCQFGPDLVLDDSSIPLRCSMETFRYYFCTLSLRSIGDVVA